MILVTNFEKAEVEKKFPRTKFVKTKNHYYMFADKERLRFLSGIPKFFGYGENRHITVHGCKSRNYNALLAFREELENDILYCTGKIGNKRNGEVLQDYEIPSRARELRYYEAELKHVNNIISNYGKVIRN